jgi:hypothetical protein
MLLSRPRPPAQRNDSERRTRWPWLALGVVVLGIAVLSPVLGRLLLHPPDNPPPASVTDVTLTWTTGRPFWPSSPFNTPIGSHVRIDPASSAMVRHLSGLGYATMAVKEEVPPVSDADQNTPRVRIDCLKQDWGRCDLEGGPVPMPANASPSPGTDHNMVVIDWSTRLVYEFWRLQKDRRTVSWGAVLPLDGSGAGNAHRDPGRFGTVGAGVSRLAGLVRTFEMGQGRIDHALVGPTGFSCRTSFRYPAVKTDGWSTRKGCIPLGARVQLDPDVHCAKLPGIRDWEIPVCLALQEYGWYNIDNADVGRPGFHIQFENPSGSPDPYTALNLGDYESSRAIPLDRLRVLKSWNSFD